MPGETPITVSVRYPMEGAERFDHSYYIGMYIPLVEARWRPFGLTTVQILRGVPGPDGVAPPFRQRTRLTRYPGRVESRATWRMFDAIHV
jgi:hypothetical protein